MYICKRLEGTSENEYYILNYVKTPTFMLASSIVLINSVIKLPLPLQLEKEKKKRGGRERRRNREKIKRGGGNW